MAVKRERTVEYALCKAVRDRGGYAIKLGGYAGIPDRLCLLPGGLLLFVELKRPGELPRKNQEIWLSRIRRLGFFACFVDSADGARELIERMMNA